MVHITCKQLLLLFSLIQMNLYFFLKYKTFYIIRRICLLEGKSFDRINMTKNLYMTEKITPRNMNDGIWPKKYDNDEHERLNMTESKNQNHIIKTTNL